MKAEIILHRPHAAQQKVLNSNARFRVLMCGRRFGKSLISQDISIDQSVDKKLIAYVTPTYQLGKIFFQEICKILPGDIYKKNEADLVITFITGGVIRFFTGENMDAMRGLKFHLVIIDEASYIPKLQDAWQNSIRPTLTDYQGKAIFLSTPKGKNYFYSLFLKGQNNEKDWASFKFTTYDNPHISRWEVDSAKSQLPEVVFEQEYMANPMENAANPFGSRHITQNIYPMSTEPVHCYGIDLAKSFDWTVIIGLDKAGNVCHFQRLQHHDWKQQKDIILSLDLSKEMLIDSTGVGDPIVEDVQRVAPHAKGFKFTSHSKQQLIEGLVQAIQQRKITYPDGPIVAELEIFEYIYTSYGVRYSAPAGFHDDCVVALALANKCLNENTGKGQYSIS